jgi:hypothetical protein
VADKAGISSSSALVARKFTFNGWWPKTTVKTLVAHTRAIGGPSIFLRSCTDVCRRGAGVGWSELAKPQNFLLWEGSSREEIGKWLKNKSVPWQRRRRLLQVVTGTFSCGQQMQMMGTENRRRVCCVRRRMRSVEAAGTASYRRRQSATFRAQGALNKRRCHSHTQ